MVAKRGEGLLANLFEGIGESQNACSDERDEDVGEDLDTTVCPIIMHLCVPSGLVK